MSTAGKPLQSANWFRVAAVRPRLRDHVRITRQHFRGEPWFVLEDLVESSVHRFAPAAQKAIGMMDGSHTLDAIWTALGELGEERPTQDEMIHLLAQLDAANLLATERLPDFGEMSNRARRVAAGQVVAEARQSFVFAHSAVRSGSISRSDGRSGAAAVVGVGIFALAVCCRLGARCMRRCIGAR